MITIYINGEACQSQVQNLTDLLIEQGYRDSVVATAWNGNFIANASRKDTTLQDGDKIEILAPMQGG